MNVERYVIYNESSGAIVRHAICLPDQAEIQRQPGERMVPHATAQPDTHYVRDGVVIAYSDAERNAKVARPTHRAAWSNTTRQWADQRTLAEAKADKWEQIKRARDAAEWGGFDTPFGRFDSDPTSQGKLSGAATAAQLNPALSLDWTLADNSVVTLGAADLIAVGLLLMQHVNTVHQSGRVLRQQIEAATTNAQLGGISWTT